MWGSSLGTMGEGEPLEILGGRTLRSCRRRISRTNSAFGCAVIRSLADHADRAGLCRRWGRARILPDGRLAGHVTNALGVENEESRDHPDIFVCGPPRLPWPEFWTRMRATLAETTRPLLPQAAPADRSERGAERGPGRIRSSLWPEDVR